MASVTLPIAGTLTNFNPLVAEGYFAAPQVSEPAEQRRHQDDPRNFQNDQIGAAEVQEQRRDQQRHHQ